MLSSDGQGVFADPILTSTVRIGVPDIEIPIGPRAALPVLS